MSDRSVLVALLCVLAVLLLLQAGLIQRRIQRARKRLDQWMREHDHEP